MKINKKISYIIFLIVCSFPFIVNAQSYYGVITGAGVRIRKNPDSTNYYTMASLGETYDMPDINLAAGNAACSNGWYKVNYGNNIGYVCSDYLKVYEKSANVDDNKTPTNDCEVQMQQAGFPASYWSGLCSLKATHSNWEFIAVNKDASGNVVDWNTSVNAEASCGKNTINSKANSTYIDLSCDKDTDPGYSNVSSAAVRYYMDPRNFLNEVNIFMFEGQQVNSNISQDIYKTASTKVFNNSFLVQQIPNLPNYIFNASNATGVSQTALASRIHQELGNAKLESGDYVGQLYSVVTGNYTSRTGYYYNESEKKFEKNSGYKSVDNYYNFFNVAAYDGTGVTQNAIAYAYKHGWGGTGNQDQDRQMAVTGGAQFLNNKYVNAGQYTAYFQKFNVFPNVSTSRYLNQYMTNIQAPVSESTILYNAYKASGILNSPFKFYIPVYQGMNNNVDNIINNSNNSNNSNDANTVETIINAAGLKYNSGYVSKINVGTNIEDIKNTLASVGGSVSVTDSNGNAVSGNIGTGYRININGEQLIAVVYGDVSGDGQINALDLLKIQKHILGTAPLNGSYKEAADPSHDGQINALDLLKVQKHILGSGNIEQ